MLFERIYEKFDDLTSFLKVARGPVDKLEQVVKVTSDFAYLKARFSLEGKLVYLRDDN